MNVLFDVLEESLNYELQTQSYFDLFKFLLKSYFDKKKSNFKIEFMLKIAKEIFNKIYKKIQKYKEKSNFDEFIMEIDQGYSLNQALELFDLIITFDSEIKDELKKNKEFLKYIINNLLIVRR